MPAQFIKPAPTAVITTVLIAGLDALVHPQPVYAMGLEQVVNGQLPDDNLFAGWRYLLKLDDEFGTAADVDQQGGGTPIYAGVSYGRGIAKAVLAAQNIETVSGIPDGNYEVRYLTIPAVLTDSLWLRATAPANDWIVPYDTAVTGLREMYPYAMASFLQILRPFAGARVSHLLR